MEEKNGEFQTRDIWELTGDFQPEKSVVQYCCVVIAWAKVNRMKT